MLVVNLHVQDKGVTLNEEFALLLKKWFIGLSELEELAVSLWKRTMGSKEITCITDGLAHFKHLKLLELELTTQNEDQLIPLINKLMGLTPVYRMNIKLNYDNLEQEFFDNLKLALLRVTNLRYFGLELISNSPSLLSSFFAMFRSPPYFTELNEISKLVERRVYLAHC